MSQNQSAKAGSMSGGGRYFAPAALSMASAVRMTALQK